MACPDGSVHGRTVCALHEALQTYRVVSADAGQPHPSWSGRFAADLARISAGWDVFWHSPFRVSPITFRQQVVSRLVDGILAYGWAEMARRSLRRRDLAGTVAAPGRWKTALVCRPRADGRRPNHGRPGAVGATSGTEHRRGRLQDAPRRKGRFPGVDTRATPWGPTAETLISTTPTGDVNEKNVAVAEWHEAHQRQHRGTSFSSTTMTNSSEPVEESFGYDYEHEHDLMLQVDEHEHDPFGVNSQKEREGDMAPKRTVES